MTTWVFLHGFLGTPAEWQPIIGSLSSPWPTLPLSLPLADHWDQGLQLLLDQLPEPCLLVGYSLGARLALGAALASPKKVRAVCLISPNPGLDPQSRAARRLHDRDVARRMLVEPWEEFLRDWYRQPIFASLDDATITAWIEQRRMLDRRYQARLLSCYCLAEQPDYWPQLLELPARTAVVAGERDRKFVEIARQMQRRAPHLDLQIVPGASHAVHREQPAATLDALHRLAQDLALKE